MYLGMNPIYTVDSLDTDSPQWVSWSAHWKGHGIASVSTNTVQSLSLSCRGGAEDNHLVHYVISVYTLWTKHVSLGQARERLNTCLIQDSNCE